MQPQAQRVGDSTLSAIDEALSSNIIGQSEAIEILVNTLGRTISGMSDPERPLCTAMFSGPTGVGKSEIVAVLAEVLFGHRKAFTRVNCQEYAAHYNLSKLLGSPPGYVGGEIKPILCQENIDRHHKWAIAEEVGLVSDVNSFFNISDDDNSAGYYSIVLFDEIEKAHPKLWDLLLGVMEEGVLVLGNNEEVDFSNTIIIVTTNVGSNSMRSILGQESVGFKIQEKSVDFDDVVSSARREVSRYFPNEFLNRFDEKIAFRPLDKKSLKHILTIILSKVHMRSMNCREPFLFELSGEAKDYLLDIGTDIRYGARPLRRTIEKEIVTPIARKICDGSLRQGDLVYISFDGNSLVFDIKSDFDAYGTPGRVTTTRMIASRSIANSENSPAMRKQIKDREGVKKVVAKQISKDSEED